MILSGSLLTIAQLVGGFLLLLFGGDWLVDGGVAIARRFRIPTLVIGLTIVAFGTSAPELLVSTISAIKGSSGIAMGNVLGSNICNIGLILGLTAMIYPILVEDVKPVTASAIMMIAVSALLVLLSVNGRLSHLEGAVMFLILVSYIVYSVIKGRTGSEPEAPEDLSRTMKIVPAILLVILACGMLAYGADLLVDGATSLAKSLGVSDRIIGLTVVAFGTSLPELAASVAAALKRQMDISIGNIIGSNIFNILGVLGLSSAITPIGFSFSRYGLDFAVMGAFAIALTLMIQPWKKTGKLSRLSGLILFLGYAAYAWSLF